MTIFSTTFIRLMKEAGLTKEKLAEKLGTSTTYIDGLQTAYITPTHDTLTKIADVFGVTLEYLAGISDNSHTVAERFLKVPVVNNKTAANMVIQEKDIEDTIVIPLPPSRDDYLAMVVVDNSMINMRIKKGDTVVIKRTSSVENGEIAAVSFDGGPVFLRKYFRRANQVTLFADCMEKKYPVTEYNLGDGRYKVIGKVIWFVGRLS